MPTSDQIKDLKEIEEFDETLDKVLTVEYTARFRCAVVVKDYREKIKQEIIDEFCSIDIPEGGSNYSEYIPGSFEVEKY